MFVDEWVPFPSRLRRSAGNDKTGMPSGRRGCAICSARFWASICDAENRAGGKMRVPFRFTVLASAAAAVAMLGVAVTHHALAAASRPAGAPAPQYNVLFSRDDKLCSTLRDFYNRHLFDRDREAEGYIEDQVGSELQRTGLEFLHESKDWKPYGSDGHQWVQVGAIKPGYLQRRQLSHGRPLGQRKSKIYRVSYEDFSTQTRRRCH
jgi:hypothetical protein